jgi:NADH:ubiquinone reductase (H+-translocating)
MPEQPRIVVIGGGFGGLNVVKALRHQPVQITLIDRENYHLFRPLLYQVAMAGLSPADIAFPLRAIFRRNPNVRTILAEVVDIDAAQRQVILADGQREPYDYLIVATGARYDYFGHDTWAPHAPSLEGIEGAVEIRRRLLLAYERAELEPDPVARQAWMTFIVVGGGPTGVELAGAIGELARNTLSQNFRTINPADSKVLLIETEERVLGGFPPELSAKAEQSLAALGVTVRTYSRVVDITEDSVTLKTNTGDERIPCRTTLWAAGVRASGLGQVLQKATGVELDRRGRVKIQPDLTLPNHPEIYAIGDVTYLEQDGQPLPGVAPVAIQQAKHAARQILGDQTGEPHQPFRYQDRGNMATIGRAAAVADLNFVRLSGFVAWVAWLFVHVINLIGFRNRLSVVSQWVFNYFTYMRSVRLIVDTPAQPQPQLPPAPTPMLPNQQDGHQDGGAPPVDQERAARQAEGRTYAA